MKSPQLVIFGCLTRDNVITADGDILPQTFGGNCLYSALGARVWSDRVGVVSRYGTDYSPAPIDQLRDVGVDTSGMRQLNIPHGRNVAFAYRADGSRTRAFPPDLIARIPPHERDRFIDSSLLPDAEARWSGFAPTSDDMPQDWWETIEGAHGAFMPVTNHSEIARAIRRQQMKPVWIQIDSPWHDRTNPSVDQASGLFVDIDAVLPSEVDVALYRPKAPVEQTVLSLIENGANVLVLKLGALGCRVFARDRGLIAEVPIVAVPTKDPTGAGDAFCGGFLAGMQLSGDVVAAARYGAVSASFAVEAHGLTGLIRSTRQEAHDRLASITR